MGKKKSKKRPARRKQKLGGPYVLAALFCEKVLREQDDIASFIRVYDSFTVSGVQKELPAGAISTNVVLLLKRGDAPRKQNIALVIRDPQAKKLKDTSQEIYFPDEPNSNALLQLPLTMHVKTPGIYTIDVILGTKRITRMLLTVRYAQVSQK